MQRDIVSIGKLYYPFHFFNQKTQTDKKGKKCTKICLQVVLKNKPKHESIGFIKVIYYPSVISGLVLWECFWSWWRWWFELYCYDDTIYEYEDVENDDDDKNY